MTRSKFDEKEFEEIGMYPGLETDMFEVFGYTRIPEHPKLNRPVSPKENWKLLFEQGKKPYWIPMSGWIMSDLQTFRPRINPDNVVCHLIFDGEECYPFESDTMNSSWFDLDWEYVKQAGGATVHPGNPKIKDITKWEDYVSMPDLDTLDWESCKKNNQEYLDVDKANQLGILCGLWERLMAVMDVDNAAIAMIDEDEKDGVKRFFDQYTNVLIGYIRRMKEILPIDSVLIHDDWGHQHSTFLSMNTYREMLVPYYKRITDAIHELGMWFDLHSCGRNETLIPIYIEMGVDRWSPQEMNDIDQMIIDYKDQPISFGIPLPSFNSSASEEELRKIAEDWVDKYKDYNVSAHMRMSTVFNGQILLKEIYRASRIAYQDVD